MSDLEKATQQPQVAGSRSGFLRQRKSWWLLPLAVLVFLLAVLYLLGHMSSADPETYPTTRLESAAVNKVC